MSEMKMSTNNNSALWTEDFNPNNNVVEPQLPERNEFELMSLQQLWIQLENLFIHPHKQNEQNYQLTPHIPMDHNDNSPKQLYYSTNTTTTSIDKLRNSLSSLRLTENHRKESCDSFATNTTTTNTNTTTMISRSSDISLSSHVSHVSHISHISHASNVSNNTSHGPHACVSTTTSPIQNIDSCNYNQSDGFNNINNDYKESQQQQQQYEQGQICPLDINTMSESFDFNLRRFMELSHYILVKDDRETPISIVDKLDAKLLKPRIFVVAVPPAPGMMSLKYNTETIISNYNYCGLPIQYDDVYCPWTQWWIARPIEQARNEFFLKILQVHGTQQERLFPKSVTQQRWMQLLLINEKCLINSGYQAIADNNMIDKTHISWYENNNNTNNNNISNNIIHDHV